MSKRSSTFLPLFLSLLVLLSSCRAATLPAGFTESVVTGGLSSATAMQFAPDGRLFVCQQSGALRVIKNGALLSTPFVTVTVNSSGERGLLGVAFDPNFASNQYIYVYYTATTPAIHNRVSRFTANGDVAVPGSETIILELNNLSGATNHNGGAIHFGIDGKLYIAVGENATPSNAQTLSNLLGKILRINSDGTIPTDNPFFNSATGVNRAIWALGLRNPFTFDVQRGTGRIFINDVGAGTFEEINEGVRGANYGWPNCEGACDPPDSRFRDPLFQYAHGDTSTTGCAITGGAWYNPVTPQFPAQYQGDYFFADLCSGWIRVRDTATGAVSDFASGISNPVDLKVGDDGSLYYLARGAGTVFEISYTLNEPPTITQHPASRTVAVGQSATFSVSAAGTSPFRYQWQKSTNGGASFNNIVGATASSYTVASATAADNGARFRCVVSNSFGTDTSNAAILTVISNRPPTGVINSPGAGALYRAGDTIFYAGTGSDPEDGALPPSAFHWRVDFHHDTHVHPYLPTRSGVTSGSFYIYRRGETSTNVWYRIYLTVVDSAGLAHTSFRDVHPRTSTLRFETSPGGLQVTLDGQPRTTPFSVASVVGMVRTIGVVSPQKPSITSYAFDSWGDGGAAATRTIIVADTDTTYLAIYRVNAGAVGTGDGLAGAYYDNLDFTGRSGRRIDPIINFDWTNRSPLYLIAPTTFSVRWTGWIQPQFSQTYTFYTRSDDGVRLWINGQFIIGNWGNHAETENQGRILLRAGQRYPIRIDYFQNTGAAAMKLLWSSASTPKSIVPRSQLYSGTR